MDDVPLAPPRDHRRDAEGPDLAVDRVDDAGVRHLVVPDPVRADTGWHPVRVRLVDVHAEEVRGRRIGPEELVSGKEVRVVLGLEPAGEVARGSAISFSWTYPDSGKYAGSASPGVPAVTALQSEAMRARNPAVVAVGSVPVCGSVPRSVVAGNSGGRPPVGCGSRRMRARTQWPSGPRALRGRRRRPCIAPRSPKRRGGGAGRRLRTPVQTQASDRSRGASPVAAVMSVAASVTERIRS